MEFEQEPEFSLPSIPNLDFGIRDDDEMEVEGQMRNEPAERQLRFRLRRRVAVQVQHQNRMLMEEDNRTNDEYQADSGDDNDDDDEVPTHESFCPYFLDRVRDVSKWYDSHGKMWPSTTTGEAWGRMWLGEISLGEFLRDMRRGARALQSGSTDERALRGMTDDKLEYLDTRLPGWFDEEDHWTPVVERICDWKSKHGALPRPLMKILMSIKSATISLNGMTDEEKEEIELGQFLALHRSLRNSFLGSRYFRCTESQFLQRLLILDDKFPNWYIVEDQWEELFVDLKEWKSENLGPLWPRLFTNLVPNIMSGEEVQRDIIRESRLALFIERQKRARFLRHGRKYRHGMTRRRERMLMNQVPGVYSSRIVKVNARNGLSRHPLVQNAIEIATWREQNSGRFPRSVIFNEQGVATPDDELLEDQKIECVFGKALLELRAARNRAIYAFCIDGLESDLENELEGILPGWRFVDASDD